MKFRDDQWISWIVGAGILVASVAAWAMTTFETKDHAKEVKAEHYREMDSIHSDIKSMDRKLDRLLLQRR